MAAVMDLRTLYLGLNDEKRARFCDLAGTTDGYMRAHLIRKGRMPRQKLMDRLLGACQDVDPAISLEQLVGFFYSGQKTLDLRVPLGDIAAPTAGGTAEQ